MGKTPKAPPGLKLTPESTQVSPAQDPSAILNQSPPPTQPAQPTELPKIKRKGGRPPVDLHPEPSLPLRNARHEAMIYYRIKFQLSQHACWLKTSQSPNQPLAHAKSNASAVFNRPDVMARLKWLRLNPIEAEKQLGISSETIQTPTKRTPAADPAQPQTQPKPAPIAAESAQIVTRERVQRLVSGALENAGTSREIIDAVGVAIKLMPQLAEDPSELREPDPTEIMRQLCSFGGHPGHELVKRFGLRVFVQRLKEFTGATNAAIIGALLPEDDTTRSSPEPIPEQQQQKA